MFIDTHAHLNMMVGKERGKMLQKEHFPIIETIIEQSKKAGISTIINVGTTVEESLNSVKIAQTFSSVFATVGIHPCDVATDWRKDFDAIKVLVKNKQHNKVVGIGETGLDFYHKPYDKGLQIDSFRAHIECALENNLPVVIHIREAADEALRVIEEYRGQLRGVNHCFCQQQYVADQLMAWGLYLGIDAPITYPKNEWFRDIVKNLPLSSLVLETDSPFLPPQSYRGKENSPAYMPIFVQVIADLKEVPLEEVANKTTHNARKLFGI